MQSIDAPFNAATSVPTDTGLPKKRRLPRYFPLYVASSIFLFSLLVVGVLVYRFQTEQSLDNSSQAAATAVGAPGTEGGLPDFSYAGYLNSTTSVPELPVVVDVTAAAYGANGSDTVPDDAAFKKAIAAAENGAVYIPAGNYYLADRVLIQKSNVELLGAGQGKTILNFTNPQSKVVRHWSKSLVDRSAPCSAFPANYKSSQYYSEYCALAEQATNGGGLIWFGPLNTLEVPPDQRQATVAEVFNSTDPNKRAVITNSAARNAMTVTVDNTRRIVAGDYVKIQQSLGDPKDSQKCLDGFKNIFQEIYGYPSTTNMKWRESYRMMSYETDFLNIPYGAGVYDSKCRGIDMVVRIKSINGNTVTFEQPLSFRIDRSWNPVMIKLTPQSRNGVRNLTIRMPKNPTRPHLTEEGYNGIAFRTVVNSWIKNVTIENPDVGISIGVYSADNTVSDVVIDSAREPIKNSPDHGKPLEKTYVGHYGVSLGYAATRNLITNVTIAKSFAHDLSVSGMANRNVFANITGPQIVLDHHAGKPYENLFTNINVGKVLRSIGPDGTPHVYQSSGANTTGPKTGARETFWNVYDSSGARVPSPAEYVQTANYVNYWNPDKKTFERIPFAAGTLLTDYVSTNYPKSIYKFIANPKNLFDAQLNMRKGSTEVVVAADRGVSPTVATGLRPFANPIYQCEGFGVHQSEQANAPKLYSNAVADSSKNITLRATASFAGKTAGTVEFCWAPYWNDATKSYVNWADGGTYFACRKVTTPLKKLANGSNTYEATMTITPNAMIEALPTAAAKNLAKTSIQKKMVVMLRLGSPSNAAQRCSANPGINTGYGSEFLNDSKAVGASTCGTDPAGAPCYQVIGYKLVAAPAPVVSPQPVVSPPPAKPQCKSWVDVSINSCNEAAQKTFATNAACATTNRRVAINVRGTNAPTAMKFYNAPSYDVICDSLKGTEAGWSAEEPYNARKAWDLTTGTGNKKVCVMLKNAGGWGTACGGGIILKAAATPTPTPKPATPTPAPVVGKEELLTKQFYTQLTGSVPATTDATYKANVALVTKNDCKSAVKNIMKVPAFVTRKNSYTNDQYVQMLYRALLSRQADAAGLQGWVNSLAQGYTNRDSIIDSMYSFSEVQGVCTARKLYTP